MERNVDMNQATIAHESKSQRHEPFLRRRLSFVGTLTVNRSLSRCSPGDRAGLIDTRLVRPPWSPNPSRARIPSPTFSCRATMPVAQLAPRNVFIYDGTQQPPLLVGGCRQFGRMTNAELYSCIGLCFQTPQPGQFRLWNGTSILPVDGNVLQMGNYFVVLPSASLCL